MPTNSKTVRLLDKGGNIARVSLVRGVLGHQYSAIWLPMIRVLYVSAHRDPWQRFAQRKFYSNVLLCSGQIDRSINSPFFISAIIRHPVLQVDVNRIPFPPVLQLKWKYGSVRGFPRKLFPSNIRQCQTFLPLGGGRESQPSSSQRH